MFSRAILESGIASDPLIYRCQWPDARDAPHKMHLMPEKKTNYARKVNAYRVIYTSFADQSVRTTGDDDSIFIAETIPLAGRMIGKNLVHVDNAVQSLLDSPTPFRLGSLHSRSSRL